MARTTVKVKERERAEGKGFSNFQFLEVLALFVGKKNFWLSEKEQKESWHTLLREGKVKNCSKWEGKGKER